MIELLKIVLGGLVGGLVAVSSTLVAAWKESKRLEKEFDLKIKELKEIAQQQREAEKHREREKIRIQYLDPLRVAAADLGERFQIIQRDLTEKREFLEKTFKEIKDKDREKSEQFAFWCNGEGYFAMSSLYVTAVYLANASKIRAELPYIELEPADDRALLDHLSAVRGALGGEFNLWEVLQDSLGTYVRRPDGAVDNYKDFCSKVIDKDEYVWFLRLIDFYRDIHRKKREELDAILNALAKLSEFLKDHRTPKPVAT